MVIPNLWLKWKNLNVQLTETVECEYLDFFDKNRNYVPWELFATPNSLYSNFTICAFLHFHRPHISGKTVSDLRWPPRVGWRANFSLRWLWYSYWFWISEVWHFIVAIGSHFALNYCHSAKLWTFQNDHWIEPTGSPMNLRMWKFKQWISERS
jgi:hypothetical protein